MLGPGGTGPQNLAQAPHIFMVITVRKLLNTGQLDTVVLLVVASQMMRGQPPIFFHRTALGTYIAACSNHELRQRIICYHSKFIAKTC